MTESLLWWGMIFGSVGLGYFIYGKRQQAMVPLFCGLILMIIPYFISNAWVLVLAGVGISAIPYFLKI